jgi:hypothetical protein
MIAGLILIVVFSAAAGSAGSIGQIIGFRAGWGLRRLRRRHHPLRDRPGRGHRPRPAGRRRARRHQLSKTPKPEHRTSILAPLRALRHRGLATMSVTALFYNWGFFTLLAYTPFPMHRPAIAR